MDKRILGLAGFIGLGALWSGFSGCSDQPKTTCLTGQGIFAVKYTFVSGDEASDCNKKGEGIGIGSYNQSNADSTRPDYSKTSKVAFESEDVLGLIQRVQQSQPDYTSPTKTYGIGDFTEVMPGDDRICHAPTITSAAVDVPAVAEIPATDASDTVPAQAAQSWTYAWSNVQVLVSAAYQGTMFGADVTISKTGDAACTATLKAVGVYSGINQPSPGVFSCLDASGNPDETQCDPQPNGRQTGSGINGDYATTCDKDLGYCVASKPFPSLK